MEGQATYTCANGDMYQGAYKANKKHGKGMYHYKVRACVMQLAHRCVGLWLLTAQASLCHVRL